MTATLDPFILEYAPGPVVALHPAIGRLRAAARATIDELGRVEDDQLTSLWVWDGNEINVRYGFYRALETIERAGHSVGQATADLASGEARDAVAATTLARWDLDGLLAGLSHDDLDADPGGGEWTIRQTLGHIIGGQRGYAWGSAYWLHVRDEPRKDGRQRPPEELFTALPEDDEEATGSLEEVRQKLHDVVDATSSRYATLTDADMAVMGGWYGFPVTIGFRMWRWPSHIEEHTVQLEKTMAMLGQHPTEVARLLRLIARAYGRLEALVFGHSPQDLDVTRAAEQLEGMTRALDGLASAIRAAADAGVPGPPD